VIRPAGPGTGTINSCQEHQRDHGRRAKVIARPDAPDPSDLRSARR